MAKEAAKKLKQVVKEFEYEIERMQKEMQSKGKEVLTQVFKEVFQTFPQVTGLQWAQYTPYFNDGETCEFSVHGLEVKLNDDDYESLDWGDLDEEALGKEAESVLSEIDSALQSSAMENVLQNMFGDHVRVTVTPKGIETEEYDHD